MIKAIAFDCGGVLFSNACEDTYLNIILEKLGISKEIENEIFYRNWPKIRIGKESENIFFQDLLNASKKQISIEELKELYYSCIVKKEAFEVVEKLHEKYPGLSLYTLNDEGKEWMDIRIEKFNLRKYFKDFITSGYVGHAKTEGKRIFEIFLEKTGLKTQDCLFIDDKEDRLIPAEEIGFKTILFKNKKQLESDLKNYGIEL